jgi:hypothetical protein
MHRTDPIEECIDTARGSRQAPGRIPRAADSRRLVPAIRIHRHRTFFRMSSLPPLLRDQRKIDASNVRLLAIFHFVLAGFALLGIGGLAMHSMMMHAILSNPEAFAGTQGATPPPNPEVVFAIFRWFYIAMGCVLFLASVANLISGLCLFRRKARVLSMVVAGFDCVGFPFGTVLGVFTLIVLGRDSVRELYESGNHAGPPPPPVEPRP